MDVVVLLLTLSFTALAVATRASHGMLRASVRRPRLFQATGPLIALTAVTAVVALGPRGNGPQPSNVGTVWACYSLLSCVIGAYALLRRRARSAIGPQEG